ncbi:hypothetical protein E2562_038410 [Oryza meyeriana var. granulata]|uniref:Uncharacterized protein n=1 Tax=Oryza meyeriana var. granulata TaxID=110450 RepID=A0A6G1FGU7_9ORYZ|nr:hypothetical protein E2562_038408 [Oryza meyeriana var. granulata]KAF0936055.1 hypothetical protein E2562_038410 [Oryza meyeriana var. granulata]
MLSQCRHVRPVSFVSALATATSSADASISTFDSDLDPESHGLADSTLLRSCMRASAVEGNLTAALDVLGCL